MALSSSSHPLRNQHQRRLSHGRLILLLIVALNTLDITTYKYKSQSFDNFIQDLSYCNKCFESQIVSCQKFLQQISMDNNNPIWWQFLSLLPQRSCKRNNRLQKIPGTDDKVIEKYFANTKEHLKWPLTSDELKSIFLQQDRLDGMQFHPTDTVDEFIKILHRHHMRLPQVTLWLYMLVNIQPILMPLLYTMDFPVPKTYATCGFTIYQEYAGQDLYKFYGDSFRIKLKISKQLIKACLKFSQGFQSYRLYITDLTADNMVYDTKKDRLTFIDLDTIFVVDSLKAKHPAVIHKHEYIECPGCFAYSPDDIAAHNISDLNIYSACQFLREDLYKDPTKGFLYPIPKNYPHLSKLLNRCVDCPWESDCLHRFDVAQKLLIVFDEIINNI
ncbi:divergent protein kinase domain 2A [Haematobia irritans]|uniref:divergent protein kinase domain 2A n=1 Tax=Haematobia irritans TaxID=7368 RepID=UPI003F5037B3